MFTELLECFKYKGQIEVIKDCPYVCGAECGTEFWENCMSWSTYGGLRPNGEFKKQPVFIKKVTLYFLFNRDLLLLNGEPAGCDAKECLLPTLFCKLKKINKLKTKNAQYYGHRVSENLQRPDYIPKQYLCAPYDIIALDIDLNVFYQNCESLQIECTEECCL